jgi:hypothetical protein
MTDLSELAARRTFAQHSIRRGTRMHRRTRVFALAATAALIAAGCGGSSGPDTRTVRRCEIAVATECVGANLAGAKLARARLNRADLRRANLRGADLRGANLRRADLRGANLQGVNLRGANLKQARLDEADMVFAQLQRASMQGATLRDADLSGAVLTGAKVDRRALERATLCATRRPNGKLDDSGCGTPATTTTTTAPLPPVAPVVIERFDAPPSYVCAGNVGQATFQWSVPQAGSVSFTVDGLVPSSSGTGFPGVIDNPDGQSFGDVSNGTITLAFTCDDLPHTFAFSWVQGNPPGVPVPGGPSVTRSVTLPRGGDVPVQRDGGTG